MQPQLPTVTPDEVEIWLQSPISKIFVECTKANLEQFEEYLSQQSYIGENNDQTCNNLYFARGIIYALNSLQDPMSYMDSYGMIKEAENVA